MITVRGARVSFRSGDDTVDALAGVDFDASPGELVLVSGPSGSGKSTLLNVIAGLQKVESGSVQVGGADLNGLSDDDLARLRLEKVGVVFQENNLIAEFTVDENVQLPLRARRIGAQEAATLADAMLKEVGIGELGRRFPRQLSGGQRQRVGIARALVGDRSILVADEPTGALDSANSDSVFQLLRRLSDQGVCVVVASHDETAEGYADRTVQIRDGAITGVYSR
ncbi:ABC transporter ATP-binding protein [Microbacterium oleivorans]|uniref:ABC transporter ATP-binding protein n=1 Tax=Microbacterium oleivorans TaxID=273677 RepID=A0A4R5YIX8_9MICO|nr:ABC transporter ATP-binding protein [Microbacterium oleivorans]TDL45295.1 ABC transporter ATP-binding protein [Microbacterium oleivorans]